MSALAEPLVAASEVTLAELFQAHYAFVWRTLRRLGVPESGVDDTAQQVFLIVSRRLADIQAGRERAYLLGVAQRVAANARRGAERRKDRPDGDDLAERATTHDTPERLLDWKQRRAHLDEWLDQLPDDLRVPFVLFELEGHSLQEIAELSSLPIGTVKTRLRRARALFLQSAGVAPEAGDP